MFEKERKIYRENTGKRNREKDKQVQRAWDGKVRGRKVAMETKQRVMRMKAV